MPRQDVNRFGEMEMFVRVVESGGFSAAARICRMTPSAVSKLISRLEARLGARLLNRSTRQLQLTPEGTVFYERSLRLLADLDEAESGVGASEVPSGRLRINTNVPIGRQFLLPLVPEFLALYPAVTLDIVLTDTVIDLMADRTDVAIRGGPLKSSSLVARKLGETPKIIVGSPDYLVRHGMPERPSDLARHNCMELGYARAIEGWRLMEDGVETVYPPTGSAQVSDGDSLRELALAGAGLARLSRCIIRSDIAAGRLVPVLEAFNPGDTEPFHIVYLGQRGRLPARVRALVDFLAARIRID